MEEEWDQGIQVPEITPEIEEMSRQEKQGTGEEISGKSVEELPEEKGE